MKRRPFKKKGRLGQGAPRTAAPRGGHLEQSRAGFNNTVHVSKVVELFLPGGGVPRGGAAKLRNRRIPPLLGRRRGQGVITGLAARRPAVLLKRAAALNRAAANQVLKDWTDWQAQKHQSSVWIFTVHFLLSLFVSMLPLSCFTVLINDGPKQTERYTRHRNNGSVFLERMGLSFLVREVSLVYIM